MQIYLVTEILNPNEPDLIGPNETEDYVVKSDGIEVARFKAPGKWAHFTVSFVTRTPTF
ncbi:hypothetical protein [uncultured Ruegeria sp.]|uniref:hypothetical protein n=1 Tax=uncultured Ruegeria sp. TaxID=259304 RepID=UPI00261E9693|nr:hypothetical protein [uncultured Ruegeria sp.]